MIERTIYMLLAAFGFAVTFALSFATEKREAWDDWKYFAIGVPAMALAAGVAGYQRPNRTWSFGFAVVAGSMAWMFAAAPLGSMFPVGLVFAVLIGLVCGVGAWLGSAVRQRRGF
jgi:hypothetical protein